MGFNPALVYLTLSSRAMFGFFANIALSTSVTSNCLYYSSISEERSLKAYRGDKTTSPLQASHLYNQQAKTNRHAPNPICVSMLPTPQNPSMMPSRT